MVICSRNAKRDSVGSSPEPVLSGPRTQQMLLLRYGVRYSDWTERSTLFFLLRKLRNPKLKRSIYFFVLGHITGNYSKTTNGKSDHSLVTKLNGI